MSSPKQNWIKLSANMSSKLARLKSNSDRKCLNKRKLFNRRMILLKEMLLGSLGCRASCQNSGLKTRCYRIGCLASLWIIITTSQCWAKTRPWNTEIERPSKIIMRERLRTNHKGSHPSLSKVLHKKNTTDYLKRNGPGRRLLKVWSCAPC